MATRVVVLIAALLASATSTAHAGGLYLSMAPVVAIPGIPTTVAARVELAASDPPAGRVQLLTSALSPASTDWIAIAGATGPVAPPVLVPFTITITVPPGEPDGQYVFSISARSDATDIGDGEITVQVGAGALPVTLAAPSLRAHWVLGQLIASLTFVGSLPQSGRLTIGLRQKGHASLGEQTFAIPPGPFTRVLKLRPDLAPGAYIVSESLTLDQANPTGSQYASRLWLESIAPPVDGYIDRTWVSARARGPAAHRFPVDTTALFASFHFKDIPRRGAITTTWYRPNGVPTVPVAKPRTTVVQGFVETTTTLAPGRWRCVLRVGGVKVGEASVRVG